MLQKCAINLKQFCNFLATLSIVSFQLQQLLKLNTFTTCLFFLYFCLVVLFSFIKPTPHGSASRRLYATVMFVCSFVRFFVYRQKSSNVESWSLLTTNRKYLTPRMTLSVSKCRPYPNDSGGLAVIVSTHRGDILVFPAWCYAFCLSAAYAVVRCLSVTFVCWVETVKAMATVAVGYE